jgi:DNA-binding CsgD family transcriptional regulator
MGKSRLLGEAEKTACRLRFKVGGGVAENGDRAVQLAPLMAALFDGPEPLLDPAELRALPAHPEQRYWLLQDIQALLEQAALEAPLMIWVDDFHWADSGTASALRVLPGRLATSPIAWVIAFRPGQGSSHAWDTVHHLGGGGGVRIVLGPLDDAAVSEIAADVMRGEPDHALRRLAGRAGGNPFMLVELLLGLREEELVSIHEGRAELIEYRLPRRVHETMHERLERMPEEIRDVATVATAIGRSFTFSDLGAVLGRSPVSLLAAVRDLIHAGLFAERDGRLEFVHDLIREAVRGSLPVSVQRAIDRQAAGVLLANGAMPVEVAGQLAGSAEPGDDLAIETLLKAAEELAHSDPGSAADLSRRALELAPRTHPLWGRLVSITAVSLHAAGRGEDAKAFVETHLRETLPPEQEAEVRLRLAGMVGLSADARVEASRLALTLPDLSAGLRARHHALLVQNLCVADRCQEARDNLAAARSDVESGGDEDARFTLAIAEGSLFYSNSEFLQARDMFATAARLGGVSDDPRRERIGQAWRFEAMMALDEVQPSLDLANHCIAAAQRDRQAWFLDVFELWHGRQLLQMGRVQDAIATLEGRFELGTDGVLGGAPAAALVALGRAALHAGDVRQSKQTAKVAKTIVEHSVPGVRRHCAWLLALQAMAAGDPDAARSHVVDVDEPGRISILPRFPIDVADEPQLVRIALTAGDPELAERTVLAAVRRAELNKGVKSMSASAAHASGLLSGDRGALAGAARAFGAVQRPLAAAAALEDLALVELQAGSREACVEALDQALNVYAASGAEWDAGRVRNRLRDLGLRRRVVSSEQPDTGWAALTQSERRVARLVAQGMTNRDVAQELYLSPNTVSSHLRRVFAKLEVNSRVALARLSLSEGDSSDS